MCRRKVAGNFRQICKYVTLYHLITARGSRKLLVRQTCSSRKTNRKTYFYMRTSRNRESVVRLSYDSLGTSNICQNIAEIMCMLRISLRRCGNLATLKYLCECLAAPARNTAIFDKIRSYSCDVIEVISDTM
jgi:hypothetical protein